MGCTIPIPELDCPFPKVFGFWGREGCPGGRVDTLEDRDKEDEGRTEDEGKEDEGKGNKGKEEAGAGNEGEACMASG